jgi:hypothetical protein
LVRCGMQEADSGSRLCEILVNRLSLPHRGTSEPK